MRVCRYGDTSYIKMRNHWLDEIPKGLLHIYDMQQKMECLLLNKLGIDYIFIFAGMGTQVMKKNKKMRNHWLDEIHTDSHISATSNKRWNPM